MERHKHPILRICLPKMLRDIDSDDCIADKTYNPLSDDEEESDRETAVTNIRISFITWFSSSSDAVEKRRVAYEKRQRTKFIQVIMTKDTIQTDEASEKE
nr:unnamed protein product [Callosobruchus analis]